MDLIDKSDYKIIDIKIQQYICQHRKEETLTQKTPKNMMSSLNIMIVTHLFCDL
jgi:hypothetical protein